METAVPGIGPSTVAVSTPARATGRLLFVDNIRIYLTVLVILHHLMVIYAGSGGWIYHEGRQDEMTSVLGGWFCAVNQAYFMGLFLFIAAYFVPGAYDRKGPARFLLDRLIRLGIPLAVYGWVLRPVFIYLGFRPGNPFLTWYTRDYFRDYGNLGGGPLWFIETLLIFSILYVVAQLLIHPQRKFSEGTVSFPGNGTIVLFTTLLGGITFLVRIAAPVNSRFAPLNLQFSNFAQYIALFVAGLVAYRRNWFTALPDKTGRLWLLIAVLLVLLYAPLGVLAGATENADPFLGGWHWQSLLLAFCFSLSTSPGSPGERCPGNVTERLHCLYHP